MLNANLSKSSFSTLYLQRGNLQTQWWLTKMESAISFFTKDRIWCVVPGSLSWWGFLSDPSPIIVYSCHSLTDSLTHSLLFGPKAKLLFRLWTLGLVKILKLKFRQDFENGVCSAFCRWCFVEVMKLSLGRDSEARFGQDVEMLMFGWDF